MATTIYQQGKGANAGSGFNPLQAKDENGGMSKKTIYPGMQQSQSVATGHNTPIAGFLYSVSRTSAGEYWPIYEGPNTIGRGADSIVRLNDPQVSEKHAKLVVRAMYNASKKTGILVYVQDDASTCGTMLNGTSLGFEPKECHHGDILTIGPNYELYLILVDATTLGLTQKEALQNVKPVEEPAFNNDWKSPQPGMFTGGSPKGTIFQNGQGGGSNPLSAPGATIYMPK